MQKKAKSQRPFFEKIKKKLDIRNYVIDYLLVRELDFFRISADFSE
jgi:hypothetical protein